MDKGFEADGLIGDLNNLVGMEQWTATAANCLDITDMGNIVTIKTVDLELEDAGSDSDSDSDSADRAEKIMCFFLSIFCWPTSPHIWNLGSRARQMPPNIASAYRLGRLDVIKTRNF
jgi:hypothetical protein